MIPGTDDVEAAKRLARHALAFPIDTILELSEKSRVPLDAVACVAAIQPLAWYQAALADGLGVAPERVPSTYAEVGHLGSAGIVANLLEGRRRGLLRDGAMVVLYAHGAGVTRYGAMVRWSSPR
jgi:3-oxoacyl-[acyl-carrier-protein] synthase III